MRNQILIGSEAKPRKEILGSKMLISLKFIRISYYLEITLTFSYIPPWPKVLGLPNVLGDFNVMKIMYMVDYGIFNNIH